MSSNSQIGGIVAEGKTPWEQASEWFARTIAIVLMMVAPGAAGAWLDGRLGTNFLSAMGFAFGMILAITLLMIFARIKPIANDGEIMKTRTKHDPAGQLTSPVRPEGQQKPSESKLPSVPGAEILEPRRDE
jgi:hypothetical protein